MQEAEEAVPQEVGQAEVPVDAREHESIEQGALDAPGEESDIANPDLMDELGEDPDPDAPPELADEDREGSS